MGRSSEAKDKKNKKNRKSVTDGPVERAMGRPTDRRTDGATGNADYTTLHLRGFCPVVSMVFCA